MKNKEMLEEFFKTHVFQDFPELCQALATFEVAEAIREQTELSRLQPLVKHYPLSDETKEMLLNHKPNVDDRNLTSGKWDKRG